ncbi:MAG: class I SAM-dependent methyltransferase [Solirubrobacteraceae bacterium]|nr:class I SAM-dependent methyltransferase [Solirubrobacteraceae bacterium]
MTITLDASTCPCCAAPMSGDVLFTGRDRWQGTPGTFEVTQCASCGAGVTLPRLPNDALGSFYPEEYAPYVPVEGFGPSAIIWRFLQKRALAGRPMNALAALTPGRIVDVGCGRGDLTAQMIALGWQATGVDPSEGACEVAAARGIDARLGTLDSVELEPEGYDAAVFQHSLEHVTDPTTALEKTRAALKPGGTAVVIIPNFGSWQRRRFGSRWFHLDLPRHRVHFTPKALAKTIEGAGLTVVEIGTISSAVGVPGSVQYAVAGDCLFPSGLPLRLATGVAYLLSPFTRLLDRLGGGGDFLWGIARRDG